MRKQSYFQPGQTIVLREILQKRVRSAQPQIVVQDEPDLLVLYIPVGTRWKLPFALNGGRAGPSSRLKGEWILKDSEWLGGLNRLTMKILDADYSVEIYRDAANDSLRGWYINLEDPFRRTALGFDFLDQMLDIIVSPDLSTWRWKDEDEFEEAVRLGVLSPARSSTLRSEGEKAIAWLQSGKSPFNGWEKWRPDPSWQIPILPEGWDIID
jgi:predicted RNA-binding protein associated with RNAse of E/G family